MEPKILQPAQAPQPGAAPAVPQTFKRRIDCGHAPKPAAAPAGAPAASSNGECLPAAGEGV